MTESPILAGRETASQVFRAKKGHERRIFRLYGKKKQTFVAQVVYVLMVRFKNRLKRASAHCFEFYLISIYKEACQ
jgi:hypothetical protein